jgi:hypothetical protein
VRSLLHIGGAADDVTGHVPANSTGSGCRGSLGAPHTTTYGTRSPKAGSARGSSCAARAATQAAGGALMYVPSRTCGHRSAAFQNL